MALFKRGRWWWIDFATPSGKRVRVPARTRKKQEARNFHDRLKADYWRLESLGIQPDKTWKDLTLKWLEVKSSKKTIEQDRRKLAYLDRWLGDKQLMEISREIIEKIGQDYAENSGKTTANRYLALIRAMLNLAAKELEWLERVPNVKLYKEPKKRVRWLKHEEADRLLSFLPDHVRVMASFTLATGFRQANVIGLLWERVDFNARTVFVPGEETKNGNDLTIPLNSDALAVLREVQGNHPKYVFTYRGRRIAQAGNGAWRRGLKAAKIENFVWHDLRHTWASWHVQGGTPLYTLKELGGWDSMVSVQRYAHLSTEHLSKHAESIVTTQSRHTPAPTYVGDSVSA